MTSALLQPFNRLQLPRAALRLALDVMTWPAAWDRAEREAVDEVAVRTATASPPATLLRYLLEEDVSRTREDTEAMLGVLWREVDVRGPIGWIALVAELAGLDIDVRDRAPIIPLRSLLGWQQVTDRLDPDLLIAYLLARKGFGRAVDRLERWGPVVKVADPDLDIALESGVSDLHVHLGALRSGQLTWSRAILGDIKLHELPRYDRKALRQLAGDEEERARRNKESARIATVLAALSGRSANLAWQRRLTIATALDGTRGVAALTRGAKRFKDCLRAERKMLVGLCEAALPELERGAAEGEQRRIVLEALALDMHLRARSAFFTAHRQPAGSNPGLGVFRLYADTLKPRPSRFGESRKLYAHRYFSDSGFYAVQSRPILRRLEVRVLPLPTVNDYVRAIGAWELIEQQFEFKQHGLEVRFAVHFKRSADRRKRRPSEQQRFPEPVALQRQLDHEAAVLFRFRAHTGKTAAKLAPRIARIDLAGQERDAGPEVAAFQMRLLRADPDALAELASESEPCSPEAHHHWLRIRDGGGHDLLPVAIDRPRLMITCHAGEDFGHPLEGLWTMETARRDLKLEAGDTLGHGLAAVTDVERFQRRRLDASLIRKGVLFDSLLWLRHEVLNWHEIGDLTYLPPIESWLVTLLRDLYGGLSRLPIGEEVVSLWQRRAGPVPLSTDRRNRNRDLARHMRWMETWDESCIARRAGTMSSEDRARLSTITPLVCKLQRVILKRLTDAGIVLELNPSSNLRIAGAERLQDVPFVRLLNEHGSLTLATLNSDDPGTFGTRIENEYALVLHALRESGMARSQAMSVLERLRDVGMRQMRWSTAEVPSPIAAD